MFAQQIDAMQEEIRGLKSSQSYNGIDGTLKMNNNFSTQNYRKEDTPKVKSEIKEPKIEEKDVVKVLS